MQPTTPTEPPDTQKIHAELPKSRHFAAYSTLEHAPAKSARENFFPKKYRVAGKKHKMLRDSDASTPNRTTLFGAFYSSERLRAPMGPIPGRVGSLGDGDKDLSRARRANNQDPAVLFLKRDFAKLPEQPRRHATKTCHKGMATGRQLLLT